jgi:hypothetical protein
MVLKTRLPDVHQEDVAIPEIATITTVDVAFTGLKGVRAGEMYLVVFDLTAIDDGVGYCATAIATADNELTVRFINPTAGAINPAGTTEMTFIKL